MLLTLERAVKPTKLNIRNEISYTPVDFFYPGEGIRSHRSMRRTIDYDVKLSNGTLLQRDFVWTLKQKQELIWSIWKEITLPRFAILIYEDTIFKIIDGKQRLSTIGAFMNNEFPIEIDGCEFYYKDCDSHLQRLVWNCDLRVNIIYEYEGECLSDEELIHWFELLNWAGTPQDRQHFDQLKKCVL